MIRRTAIYVMAFFLAACAPSASVATPQMVTVYATDAAQPWLTELYN